MQQENEQAAEFQDHDTRTWASFERLASRWERTSGLDQEEMLNELLQGYLRGEIWPAILPNLYGGHEILTASPAHPYWMKTTRRFPIETFTRLDFLRAAKAYGHLHVDAEDSPFTAGYRGLIGVPLNSYALFFIETYIKKLTPSPNAVVRWCSDHGWPVPPGLSCSEKPSPNRKRPAEQMHKRWVERAKELKTANKDVKVSEIARKIRSEDAKAKDPNTKGQTRDQGTIRRVLYKRRSEWDIPQES